MSRLSQDNNSESYEQLKTVNNLVDSKDISTCISTKHIATNVDKEHANSFQPYHGNSNINTKDCLEHERSSICSDSIYSGATHNTHKQNSAFTMVSPSRQGLQLSYKIPSSYTSTHTKTNLQFQSSETSSVRTVPTPLHRATLLQSSFRESHSISKNPLNLPVTSNKENEPKSKDTLNCDNVHFLPDIQEENTSDLSMNNFTEVVVTTASCQQLNEKDVISNTTSQSTQTLLLAVPENLNVNQLSNQTLNLDYNSQQLLQSLLQLSTASENSIALPMVSTTTAPVDENSMIDNSHELVIDAPTDPDITEKHNDNASEILEQGDYHTEKLCDTNLEKENDDIIKTAIVNKKNEEDAKNSEHQREQLGESEIKFGESQNQLGELQNQLPTAAISVNLINGQPVYTIQLNGMSIPIAAITIPTADGPRHLQSAITSLPPSTTNKISKVEDLQTTDGHQLLDTWDNDSSNTNKAKLAVHKCEICGKSYVRKWCYYSHMREHSKPNEQKCLICSESFQSTDDLKNHMVSNHSNAIDFTCALCGKNYNNQSLLEAHQQMHTMEKTFSCEVDGCGKSFPNANALKTHQRVHQEEKPFKCDVPDCGKAFKTPSELSRHAFRHTGEKPYKCDKCEKSFVRNDDLRRHSFTHTGQKRFKCDQCDFSCIQSFDLVKHKYIHGGEKPYKCAMCPKQFTRPIRLREHERLHTGERPYTCEECGKSFSQQTSLKSHKLTHQPSKLALPTEEKKAKIQCLLCNKEFVSEKTLKRHAIVHTGEKPFECKVCHRKFARAGDLKVHSPVHHAEKPYKCEQCFKTFTRFSSLKEHTRLHTGEFPFKCDYCEKIFNHRSHLNVHMRSHTGERPHKCSFCPKEFSRKLSLRHHLRTHGATIDSGAVVPLTTAHVEATTSELCQENDDVDSNFSEANFMEGHPSDIQFWKSLQSEFKSIKRKRSDSDDDAEEDQGLLHKRLMANTNIIGTHITPGANISGYPTSEEILSSMSTTDATQEIQPGGEVDVVNTSSMQTVINPDQSVIFHQLSSGALTQSHYLNTDSTTVVTFSLAEPPGEVESLVEIHGLDGIQGLDTESLIEQQQLNQHIQQDDMHNVNNNDRSCC